MTRELPRTSCAAPEGHTQRGDQQRTKRGKVQNDAKREKKVADLERRQPQREGRGGGTAGRRGWAVGLVQGTMESGEEKDGLKKQQRKRESGVDKWALQNGNVTEGSGPGRRERNEAGGGVRRGKRRKDERADRGETREREEVWGWREKQGMRERWGWTGRH